MPASFDSKEFGRLLALSQIGLEMALPIALGAALDYWLDWSPWAIIVGAVLGFITGMVRILKFLNRPDDADAEENREDVK